MAFVIAYKGKHYIKVSKQSYEKLFKNKGFKLANEPEKVYNVEEEKEAEYAEESETPVSEMNRDQLMKFAKEHDIDTSGARNVKEARQIIQKAVREHNL